jgi:hypothetical protein
MLTGGGTVAVCPTPESCHIAAKSIFKFPNGIIRDYDGLYYVSNTLSGRIYVLELQPDNSLVKIDEIYIGMPIDNLSIDANGDIFLPGFPKVWAAMKGMRDPWKNVPTTVFRIRKLVGVGGRLEWEVEKVLEDVEGKVTSFTTAAAHDVNTGSLVLAGIMSPFVTVCEKRA